MQEIQIIVAGNFQEYRIAELVALDAPVDKVILGTEFITPADDPKLEAVLKMAQFVKNGDVHHTAKLAKGKVSYPGVKQVFRTYDDDAIMTNDVIGLEDEDFGKPLLKQYVKEGALVEELPELDGIRKHLDAELASLPEALRRIDKETPFDVRTSERLEALLEEARNAHQSS